MTRSASAPARRMPGAKRERSPRHEDYQILSTEKIHFDDREVAREEAERRAGG